ncbi:MAG: hypothetical protein BGO07_00260 [Alphaproteobacteria bacterium 40-19]|nr:MAG: hypothetical protein BGO07_00260 [Alphaproteobacteria bacterium 40-19]
MKKLLAYNAPERNQKIYWEVTIHNIKKDTLHLVVLSMDQYGKGTFYDPNFGMKKIAKKMNSSEYIKHLIKKQNSACNVVFDRVTKKDFENIRSEKKIRQELNDNNSFCVD